MSIDHVWSRRFITSIMKTIKHKKTKEEVEEEQDSDAKILHDMGYTQELYRGFSSLMSFTFCFTAVNVFSSISLMH